ncbi:unnamed protein product (macronuclear) [Paramecium tetraurelia]|uniref:Cyclic nucleotide-binding domain-containing protein n=1 Tax=Paramecium tetraurelia TaxID=5888 RepID=A0CTQ4_PARTE|nr:uncharacterized protein GSPATT00010405001 [Paramecium tetraurelia]CAK74171.1 unnamed protein product [Paramecium tetraurelia]|eukprot:XP_001441568.1 hypothetical protein (macronuclear) [Paramecium tetraurelia strain d4-2]
MSKVLVVLKPTSKLLKYWSLLYLLIMIIQIIIIPLQIEPFFVLFLILKVIDALLNSISTFAINGEIETQLTAIINHYCKSQLVFDLIFLGSLLFQQNYWSIIINLLSNIPRLIQIQKQVQLQISILNSNSEYNIFNSFSLLSILITKAILLTHVLTCFWLFNLLIGNEDSFLEQYLHSLYYVLSIMTFNSVVIDTSDQQNIIVYSVISLFSLICFSYFLAKMLTIFRDDELDQQLSEFMTQNNLDSTLKQKIISHLLYQPKYLHDRFISQLSSNLIQEYKISQRSKLINQYFKYFNQNTIQSIIDNSYEIVCQPNQTIIQEGTLDDCSLYFILEGSVCLKSRTNIKLQILKQNNSFGEIGFYTQKPRNFTIQSDGVTRLLKIERTTFLSCLSFNDKQLFYQQRDKILFNQGLPIKCACCQKDDHIITRCPLLTYKPNQSLILQKFIFPHKQSRKQYKRSYFKDMRALNFYQCASQYEVAFLKLFSDQLQQSQLSQSQLPYDDFAVRDSNVSARSLTKFSRDRSVVKSTSFMKQQSGYEQQSMPNNTDNLFPNFDQDNEFQIINNNQDKKYDEFESLIRTDQQKRTFATAGFGSQSLAASNKDLTQKSLNIILENEDSDSISEPKSKSVEEENVVDSPQDKFERKNIDPKLTFNYNFETQMNELQKQNQSHPRLSRLGSGSIRQQSSRNSTYKYPDVISQRQNSSRSLTYSPIPSNSQIKSGMPSSKQHRKSTFSFPQKLVQQTRQVDTTNLDDSRSQQQRHSIRKISTKTGTKVSIIPSCFQPFSNVDLPLYANNSFGLNNFDAMYSFDYYLPHNNYEITIYKANKFRYIREIYLSKYLNDYHLSNMIQLLKQKRLKTMKTYTSQKKLG